MKVQELLNDESRWTQYTGARDRAGQPVEPLDPEGRPVPGSPVALCFAVHEGCAIALRKLAAEALKEHWSLHRTSLEIQELLHYLGTLAGEAANDPAIMCEVSRRPQDRDL